MRIDCSKRFGGTFQKWERHFSVRATLLILKFRVWAENGWQLFSTCLFHFQQTFTQLPQQWGNFGRVWKTKIFIFFVFAMHLMGWKFHGIIINIHRGKIQYDQSSECDCFWWGLSLQCKGKQPWVAKVLRAFILKQNFNSKLCDYQGIVDCWKLLLHKKNISILQLCPLYIADPSW